MRLKEKIKEFLFACYDPNTYTIHGCEEGTMTWHHEDRHRQQAKGGKVSLCYTYMLAFMLVLIVALSYDSGNSTYILFSVLMLAFYMYLEIDAHIYSYKMMKNKK